MNLEQEQPLPEKRSGQSVQSMVIADMATREKIGIERYGQPLYPNNGRDTLRDAYEEALDLATYLRALIAERDGEREPKRVRGHAWLADGVVYVPAGFSLHSNDAGDGHEVACTRCSDSFTWRDLSAVEAQALIDRITAAHDERHSARFDLSREPERDA